jgi:hypothetical protein
VLPTHLDPAAVRRRGTPAPSDDPPSHVHPPALSRRRFLGGAGALGAALGATALAPGTALAGKKSDPTPSPIPGGFTIEGTTFHVFGFDIGLEPSTITDFNGFIGICDVQGTGTATNPDGSTETLLFDTDMRFMQGVYMGADDRVHQGTFGFV